MSEDEYIVGSIRRVINNVELTKRYDRWVRVQENRRALTAVYALTKRWQDSWDFVMSQLQEKAE